MTPLELFESNKGLAYSAANRFRWRFPRVRQDRDILANYALFGLWVAAKKWCPQHGCDFAGFARKCIGRELLNGRRELDDCGIRLHPRRQVRNGNGPPVAFTGLSWDEVADVAGDTAKHHAESFQDRLPFLDATELWRAYELLVDGTPLRELALLPHGGLCWRYVAEVLATLAKIKAHYPSFSFLPPGFRKTVLRAARAYVVETLQAGPQARQVIMDAVHRLFGLDGSRAWRYQAFVFRGGLVAEWLPNANGVGKSLYWRLPTAEEAGRARQQNELKPLPCGT